MKNSTLRTPIHVRTKYTLPPPLEFFPRSAPETILNASKAQFGFCAIRNCHHLMFYLVYYFHKGIVYPFAGFIFIFLRPKTKIGQWGRTAPPLGRNRVKQCIQKSVVREYDLRENSLRSKNLYSFISFTLESFLRKCFFYPNSVTLKGN